MGRIYIELDPEGYYRLEEPGFTKRWTGKELLEALPDVGERFKFRPGTFWNPSGTEVLMPRPRQFNGDWYSDPRLSDHLLRRTAWTFADGITSINEYDRARKAGGSSVGWYWTRAYIPSAGVTALDDRSFSSMAEQLEIALPLDLKTVATATTAPDGSDLLGGYDFCPWFGFVQYPMPDDVVVFGWSNLAVLWTSTRWHLFRSPLNDGQNWELLTQGGLEGQATKSATGLSAGMSPAGMPIEDLRPVQRAFMAVPVWLDRLWCSFEKSGEAVVKVKEGVSGEVMLPSGNWWIATPGGVQLDFQAQVVGYESASTELLNVPDPAIMFDLGAAYHPTEDPEVSYSVLMHDFDGGSEPPEAVYADNEWTFNRPAAESSNEQVIIGVRDEEYAQWDSDGTHHKGGIKLFMRPDSQNFKAYLSPQIKEVVLRFPEKRTARARNGLVLDDTQWAALSVGTSLRDPLGKRLTFSVWDRNASLLQAQNLDRREGYPVHILEDVDNDGVGEVLRARGWVHNVRLEELKTEPNDAAEPLRLYLFECRGLLQRADEGWLHPPTLTNPNDPYLEHDYAVKEALRQAAFDPADTDFFSFYTDPWAGTDVARLPGSAAALNLPAGMQDDGAYNPDWDEPKIKYAQRVAEEWRGWLLYEDDTKIQYHPDLAWAVNAGELYYPAGTLYRGLTEATTANPLYPGQYVLAEPASERPPMFCNTIRVSGKDPGKKQQDYNQTYHVLDRLSESITDSSSPHFLGEERVYSVVSKFAVSEAALSQVARLLRLRKARRLELWAGAMPIAPWRTNTGSFSVGEVWLLYGKGDILLTNVEWSLVGKGNTSGQYVWRTKFQGEMLPSTATPGDTADGYRGRAISSEEEV